MKSSTRLVLACLLTFLLLSALPFSCRVMAQTYQQYRVVSATSYTVVKADCGRRIKFTSNSAVAVTVPRAGSTTGRLPVGCNLYIYVAGDGTVTLTPTTSTIAGGATLALTKGVHVTVSSDGTNYDVTQQDLTDAQRATAADADISTIAGLSPSNDDLLQRKSGAWANRTLAQVKTDLALNNVDNTSDATKNAATVTLTNKTVALGSNTVSGTIAQFNTALTDDDFATLGDAETFTGLKTFTDGTLKLAGGDYGSADGSLPSPVANAFIRNTYSATHGGLGSCRAFLGKPDASGWDEIYLPACTGAISTGNGGLGADNSASSGVPLFATGTVTMTSTSGSGNFVRVTSPTMVTPTLGAASATSINGLTITSSTGTLTIANGKTATVSNTLTFTGTDSSSVAFGAGGTVSYTIASGTSALGTSAISSGACATVVTTSATGTATTDVIWWGFNADPTSTTGYSATANGMLTIIAYPTANNVNYKVCNNTASSITPGAVTLNWRVVR